MTVCAISSHPGTSDAWHTHTPHCSCDFVTKRGDQEPDVELMELECFFLTGIVFSAAASVMRNS